VAEAESGVTVGTTGDGLGGTTGDGLGGTADEALLRAVERFAQTLEMSGMPRMAARLFAYVLAEDGDRYTASQLADGLRVSPAAVSGAVRYLTDVRLLYREREPGMRSDLFRINDEDVWRTIMMARVPLLEQWVAALDEAVTLVGESGRGGQRLAETREFFAFMATEMPALLDRWAEHRRELFG
jgi:DNA-binding transcriptional regulator GbsR (MarR family)